MQALDRDQAKRFLEAASDDRWYALWLLLLTSGLHPGEALALKWTDLDGSRLRVRRTLGGYRLAESTVWPLTGQHKKAPAGR